MSVLYIMFVAARIIFIILLTFIIFGNGSTAALIMSFFLLLGIFVDYFAGSRLHKFYR